MLPARSIDLASPTLAWQLLTCAHALGLRQQSPQLAIGQRTNPPPAVLGTTAHMVLELALKAEPLGDALGDDWFEQAWSTALCQQLERCAVTTPPERWRRFSIIKRGTRKLVPRLRSEVAARSARPHVEIELRSARVPVWGRPDVILEFPDGSAEIIDFKTGAHESPEPTQRELFQLDIYCALVAEILELEVRTLRIERCDQPGWSQRADFARSSQAVRDAVDALMRFNDHRDDTSLLANPGGACEYCLQAPRCDIVWSSRPDCFVGVQGEIEQVVLDGDVTTVLLQQDGHGVSIVGCPALDIATGQRVRIAHLVAQGDGAYRWRHDRTILSQSGDL